MNNLKFSVYVSWESFTGSQIILDYFISYNFYNFCIGSRVPVDLRLGLVYYSLSYNYGMRLLHLIQTSSAAEKAKQIAGIGKKTRLMNFLILEMDMPSSNLKKIKETHYH